MYGIHLKSRVLTSLIVISLLAISIFDVVIYQQEIMGITPIVIGMTLFLVILFNHTLCKTEQRLKKMFNELRHSQSKLANAERLAHLGNLVWDQELRITETSQEARKILGIPDALSLQKQALFLTFIHPDDKADFFEFIQDIKASHGTKELTHRIIRADGTERIIRNRSEACFAADGSIKGFNASVQDVTEQQQAEQRSVQLGQILQHSWNEIYSFDAQTLNFIDISDGLCRNLGYDKDEISAMKPTDIMASLSKDQFNTLLLQLTPGIKKQYSFEAEHLRKDGSRYPVEISLQLASLEKSPTFIAIIQDISNRKNHIEQLEHQALHDELTGLPNRSLLMDRLECALHDAHRESSDLAVLMVKALRLREINDVLGHQNGDQVLRKTAQCLLNLLRETDTVARLESNEFVIVLTNTQIDQAQIVAGKIQSAFEEPIVVGDIHVAIEVTIGISHYPSHTESPQNMLQYADIAMQSARNEAGGISLYRPENDPFTVRHLQLHSELRQAIKNAALALYYQPKLDIMTNRVTGMEALARWPHSSQGMVSPADFIPWVEQSGLIRPFTHWVLETAIKQASLWQNEGLELSVSINLSTRNLVDPELPKQLVRLMAAYPLDPQQITLEITESAIMYRPEYAIAALGTLNKMGFKLSIDDFGTGYSSLAYLRHLPVHELKIDQSFITNIYHNDSDAMIVKATIDLAHNLNLQVVAEGIENEETLALLKSFGCDIAQGYFFSRPLPSDEFSIWLRNTSQPTLTMAS